MFKWLFELQDNKNAEKYDSKGVKHLIITVFNKQKIKKSFTK